MSWLNYLLLLVYCFSYYCWHYFSSLINFCFLSFHSLCILIKTKTQVIKQWKTIFLFIFERFVHWCYRCWNIKVRKHKIEYNFKLKLRFDTKKYNWSKKGIVFFTINRPDWSKTKCFDPIMNGKIRQQISSSIDQFKFKGSDTNDCT